jgi:hypothetical protein
MPRGAVITFSFSRKPWMPASRPTRPLPRGGTDPIAASWIPAPLLSQARYLLFSQDDCFGGTSLRCQASLD